MLGKPDLSETEFNTLTSINLAIGGVKSLSDDRVRDDSRPAANDVALRGEMVAAAGVGNPKDTVRGAHGRNATNVLDDRLQGQRPHKPQHRRNFVCSALGHGGQVRAKVGKVIRLGLHTL